MGLCGWILFGFLAGLVARAIKPGKQDLGLVATTVLGVAGSFAGGFIGAILSGRDPTVLRPSGFIGAIIGALVLLVVGEAIGGRKRH
jgi:uncharacterized membrane protein YeaQ/YmgE (transglycosylase-associated protein family)